MKFKILSTVLIGGVLLTTSCSKKYLTRAPYNAVPLGSAISSSSDLVVAATGMYSALRNTDVFGRTLPVKGDLMAYNTFVTASNSGRYLPMSIFSTTNLDACRR